MEIYQGQQIKRYIGGDNTGFDDCSQIEIAIYENETGNVAMRFFKVSDPEHNDAGVIEASDSLDYNLMITVTKEMTEDLAPGEYCIEISRTMVLDDQIFKSVANFFTVKKSRTV